MESFLKIEKKIFYLFLQGSDLVYHHTLTWLGLCVIFVNYSFLMNATSSIPPLCEGQAEDDRHENHDSVSLEYIRILSHLKNQR